MTLLIWLRGLYEQQFYILLGLIPHDTLILKIPSIQNPGWPCPKPIFQRPQLGGLIRHILPRGLIQNVLVKHWWQASCFHPEWPKNNFGLMVSTKMASTRIASMRMASMRMASTRIFSRRMAST